MAKEQSYRLPLDSFQWKVFVVPDFRKNESLFVYKVHHSLADGIANILFFNDMTDEPTMEGYPNLLVRLSFLQNVFIKISLPFYMNYLSLKMLICLPRANNGFKNDKVVAKLSSHKNVEFVPDINLDDIKKRAQELSTPKMKVTINDVLMTVLSKSIRDYLREHTDDKTTTSVRLACPFSLRPPPKHLGDYTFDNNFAVISMKLRLIDSLKDGLADINQDMLNLKKSFEPIGSYYLTKITNHLPEFMRRFAGEKLCSSITFGYSNVPGPKRPFVIAGKENNGIGFIMPVGFSIVGSFSIISHMNVIKVIITMDKAIMSAEKIIKEIFVRNMDEMLEGPAWQEFHKKRND